MIPKIAISMGDYNGIGPEVALKTLEKIDLTKSTPVWIGNINIFLEMANQLGTQIPHQTLRGVDHIKDGVVNILPLLNDQKVEVEPGKICSHAGLAAMDSVEYGIQLCLEKKCHALVTSPISKESISKAGYSVPGHTEFLAEKTGSQDYMMILTGEKIRVGLSTVHIPVKRIAEHIRFEVLKRQIKLLNNSLIQDFGIKRPQIAVLGLNPHAGDGGVLGDEEIHHIIPAIEYAKSYSMNVDGPFSADGFFASHSYKNVDAILAMYHDQGLIPFKTISFGNGVNFTAGLPIIRTSPDHGTAFTIAGKNTADYQSFNEAYLLATKMAYHRVRLNA